MASIPKSICLSHRTSSLLGLNRSSTSSIQTCSHPHCSPPLSTHPTLILTHHLLHELNLGDSSQWSPYLSLLFHHPHPTPSLISFFPQLASFLLGTEVHRLTQSGLTITLDQLHHHHSTHAPPNSDWNNFQRAYAIVSSRAFWIDNFHTLALVPLADLFDHSDDPDLVFTTEDVVCGECGSFDQCPHDDHLLPSSSNLNHHHSISHSPSIQIHQSPSSNNLQLQHHLNHLDHQTTTHLPSSKSSSPQALDVTSDDDRLDLVTLHTLTSSCTSGPHHSLDKCTKCQVYNSYGQLGNARLLLEYGFMLEANAYDRIGFDLDQVLSPGSQARISFQHLLQDFISQAASLLVDDNELVVLSPDQLWIDSEAKLSSMLWLAIVSFVCHQDHLQHARLELPIIIGLLRFQLTGSLNSELDSELVATLSKSVANQVRELCTSRLAEMYGSHLPVGDLLDMKQVSQERLLPNFGRYFNTLPLIGFWFWDIC